MSLVRAFLEAGATGVVAGLWKVSDSDTTPLLADLHRRLAAGEELAEALAESQRAQRHAGAPTAAWSAFTVVGGSTAGRRP